LKKRKGGSLSPSPGMRWFFECWVEHPHVPLRQTHGGEGKEKRKRTLSREKRKGEEKNLYLLWILQLWHTGKKRENKKGKQGDSLKKGERKSRTWGTKRPRPVD